MLFMLMMLFYSKNTTLTRLDGFSLEGVEYATFFTSQLQYHHVVMAGLYLAAQTTVKSLEYDSMSACCRVWRGLRCQSWWCGH